MTCQKCNPHAQSSGKDSGNWPSADENLPHNAQHNAMVGLVQEVSKTNQMLVLMLERMIHQMEQMGEIIQNQEAMLSQSEDDEPDAGYMDDAPGDVVG